MVVGTSNGLPCLSYKWQSSSESSSRSDVGTGISDGSDELSPGFVVVCGAGSVELDAGV